MTGDEAMKTIREALRVAAMWIPDDSSGDTKALFKALAALDSLSVETGEDVEGVVRDISTLCHTKAAVYFDFDMCSRIITTRDERIRRECADRVEAEFRVMVANPDIDNLDAIRKLRFKQVVQLRAAIIGDKE